MAKNFLKNQLFLKLSPDDYEEYSYVIYPTAF